MPRSLEKLNQDGESCQDGAQQFLFSRKVRYVSISASLLLVGAGLFANLFDHVGPSLSPFSQDIQTSRVHIQVEKLETITPYPTASVLHLKWTASISILYTTPIQLDQSLDVRVKSSTSTDLPIIPAGEWMTEMTLTGAAFDIAPSGPVKVAVPTDFPITRWTALAKRTGEHMLLLDCSKCAPYSLSHPRPLASTTTFDSKGQTPNDTPTKIRINGQEIAEASFSSIRLPVKVITKWGVSQRTFDIVYYLLLAVGTVLGIPFLVEFLTFRWLFRKSSQR